MRKKMLEPTTEIPIVIPAYPMNGSGIRRVGEEALRDGWIDRQFRLTADLLHLRMRLDSARKMALLEDRATAWAHAIVDRLETLKDAMYEVSADALAPPMAPMLTPSSLFLREAWAIYAWCDGVVATLVARLRAEARPESRAPLPGMNAMAGAIAELEAVLGAMHALLPRAREHVAEAFMVALGIEAEVASSDARDA